VMVSARLRNKLDAVFGSKQNPKSLPYPKASPAFPGSIRSLSQSITDDSPQTTSASAIILMGHKLAHNANGNRGIQFGLARHAVSDLSGASRTGLRAKRAHLSVSAKERS
jgi:hypothetical protein